MAYSATIDIVQEDDLPAITYTIKDKNSPVGGQSLDPRDSDTWATVNLVGSTLSVDVREKGKTEVIETLSASAVDAANGVLIVNIVDAIFKTKEGKYELETVITSTAGLQQTVFDFMLIRVRSRIKVSAA